MEQLTHKRKSCYRNKMRREYALRLKVNGRSLDRVVIDSHYEKKHSNVVNDALILDLVKHLNGHFFEPDSLTNPSFV